MLGQLLIPGAGLAPMEVEPMAEFTIDEEFRSQIPALTDGEKAQLEASIDAEGCRDALVVWKEEKVLLDGHNRFEICTKLGKKFEVVEKSLPDRTAAMIWIIKNQVGRRNLSESQRAMCAARLANLERGDNQHTAIAATSQSTAAQLFNVSIDSVQRAKAVLESGSEELIAAVDNDEIAVSAAAEIANLPKEDQGDVLKKGKEGITAAAKEVKRKKAKARKEKREKQKADAVKLKHPLDGERFRLICGDISSVARQIKDASIDAIITDPPYGEEYVGLYRTLAMVAARVLRPHSHCLVMTGQANLPEILKNLCSVSDLQYQWTLAYFTPGESVQVFGRKIKSNWKPVIWLVKGKCDWEHVEDTVRSDMNDKRFHEWGQSVGGIAQLIERFTVKKSTVFDPFVGGGSTAMAALSLDRFFVGIDIEKSAIQETAKRIEGAKF